MANVIRTAAPVAAPSAVDPYYEAQKQQALAEMLAQRANANGGPPPRTSQAAILNGLNDILARSASGKAADRAQVAKAGADRTVSDQNAALIQAMMRRPDVNIAGFTTPGKMDPTTFERQKGVEVDGLSERGAVDPMAATLTQAVSGMDPMAVKRMLAKMMYERAMPDPSQVADREARLTAAQLASDDRQAALAQREAASLRADKTDQMIAAGQKEARDAATAATAEARARDAALREASDQKERDLKLQLAQMKADVDDAKRPASTSAQAGAEFMRIAGYNPETGEDDVLALLNKASGGAVDAVKDAAARAVNKGTEGSMANQTLKSKASDIVYGMLGGKLGQGVSNGDRIAMEQRVGDVGNENLSKDERIAAWMDVRRRMTAAAGMATTAPAAPAGSIRSFATEAEAEAAGLDSGTPVIIGGVKGKWQ